MTPSRVSTHAITRAVVGLILLLLLSVAVLACVWRAGGGRWFMVETPSMGRAAPVGTLLLTRPVAFDELHTGEFITFHAPTSGEVYSHRIVAVTPAGLKTRGDINGVTDPWTLTRSDVIGRVAARWWYCGWLLRAVPLALTAAGAIWLTTTFLPPRTRSTLRLLGASAAASLISWWLKPWVGLIRLGTTGTGSHLAVRAVSTGILPIRVADARGGHATHFTDGTADTIPITHHTAHGAYRLTASLDLGPWGWGVLVAICLIPLLFSCTAGLPEPFPPPADDVLAEDQPWHQQVATTPDARSIATSNTDVDRAPHDDEGNPPAAPSLLAATRTASPARPA